MSAVGLARRVKRLEGAAEPVQELTLLDILRMSEALAGRPDGLAIFQETGWLAKRDAEEARWRSFQARLEPGLRTAMLDGEGGRWPVLRARALWHEREYAQPGELRSATTHEELEERWQRLAAEMEA